MHILYLVPHVPNPTKVRSHFQIRGLLEAGHRVTVATLRRGEADDKHLKALQASGCELIWVPFQRPTALLNAASVLPTGLPLQARLMWSDVLMRKIEAYLHLSTTHIDVVHVEHLRMAAYGLQLRSKWPVVWDAVDYLSALFEQAASSSVSRLWQVAARLEAPRLKGYERWLTGQFPTTLVISKRDQALFQQSNEFADRVRLVPLGLPIAPLGETQQRGDKTLVITGTLNYHPNVASVLYFVREIFPLILRHDPQVKLQLVGSNPVESIQSLQSSQVEVTGFVPSIHSYLEAATLALAPVTYGSGVQVKVIEAFATATPLVATSTALRGLDVRHQEHALVADTPRDFADAVIALLSDAGLRQAIGSAGRQYVEQHHDLQKTTQQLIDVYRTTISSI